MSGSRSDAHIEMPSDRTINTYIVPLPIFVELQGLVGTVRLRLQMSPEPPFLKALTFTLMGLPQVQAGCVPMLETGINILNLPLISNFVNYAIGMYLELQFMREIHSLDLVLTVHRRGC